MITRILILLIFLFIPLYAHAVDPNSEVRDAVLFLEKVPESDRPYIRFFSTYAIPPDLRDKTALTLSFVCHSLTGLSTDPNYVAGSYYPIATQSDDNKVIHHRLVPDSNTLYWIDLREYNWTPQSWEAVSKLDPYFVEPVVQHDRNSLLRLLAGNAILRADWFIYHGTDITAQSDRDIETKIYYELLYSSNTIPKNVEEFRQVWGLDLERARKYNNEYGTVVLRSKTVARHNRILMGYRTEVGWLYETYDVKNEAGRKDYLETLPSLQGSPPQVSDAGEIFASNQLHLQVYALRGGDGNLVDFADPTIARHMSDYQDDARVRTAYSCMDCHAAGPIIAENTLQDYKDYLNPQFPDYISKLKSERVFLGNKFNDSVSDNQKLFERAMKKVNGLTPEKNLENYIEIVDWYRSDLDLIQIAIECGIDEFELIEKIQNSHEVFGVDKVPGRLKLAIHPTNPMFLPRDIWDDSSTAGVPGLFQQAMIIVYGLTEIVDEKIEVTETDYEIQTFDYDIAVYKGKEQIYEFESGREIPFTGIVKELNGNLWMEVMTPDGIGYVKKKEIENEK